MPITYAKSPSRRITGRSFSPLEKVRSILGTTYTQKSHFTDFIATFQTYINTPSLLDAESTKLLDMDGDGVLTVRDRDYWLHYLIRKYLGNITNLPTSGNGWSNTPTDSDPLGLRATGYPSGTHVIIIDPLNPNSVKIDRGTNQCRDQGGTALSLLFTTTEDSPASSTNTYNYTDWFELDALDESNFFSITPGNGQTCRRFPNNLNQRVFIYFRGGSYIPQKEIHLQRNNGNWELPQSIEFKPYPGEAPVIYLGPSQYQSGEGDNPVAGALGKYRCYWCFNSNRGGIRLYDGIKWVGNRGTYPNKTFAYKGIRIANSEFGDYSCVIQGQDFKDFIGVPQSQVTAGTYNYWVDSQYNNRVTPSNVSLDPGTGVGDPDGLRALVSLQPYTAPGTTAKHYVTRNRFVMASAAVPEAGDTNNYCPFFPDTWVGEGLVSYSNRNIVRYNYFSGVFPHYPIAFYTGTDNVIEYNDVQNNDNGGIGSGDGSIVRYNRIHDMCMRRDEEGRHVQMTDTNNGNWSGNVLWNSHKHTLSGVWALVANIGLTTSGNNISYNIIYDGDIAFIYPSIWAGNDHNMQNNDIHHNVIMGPNTYSRTQAAGYYNALFCMETGNDTETNLGWGNKIRENTLWFLDPLVTKDYLLIYQGPSGATYNKYGLNGAFPNHYGNVVANPLFTNPSNGDFSHPITSPIRHTFPADTPFQPFSPWGENPVDRIFST